LLALAALSATLLLANLGSPYLWQDEAQTALLARSILEHGIPHGTDGTNSFSQELGVEIDSSGVWRWHTWLSFYAVAASFALFGETTLAARLPFALFGIGCVLLTWALARELWRDRLAAGAAGGLLALSVPFLLLARQSRWYALAAFLSLAGLAAYARIDRGRRFALGFFVAALLLFHTHYLYCAVLLGSCGLHAAWLARERLRQTLVAAAGVSVVSLPWLVWLSDVPLNSGYGARLVDAAQSLSYLWVFSKDLVTVFLAFGLWLLALPLVALRRARRGEPAWAAAPGVWSGVALVALHTGIGLVLLAALSPGTYLRYLTPLVPPLFAAVGLVVAALARAWPAVAAVAVAAWLVTGSLDDFTHELTHDYDGPIEGIVRFLAENARPGDTVAITYGDLPVKFYLRNLRVVGGLTGEDLAAASGAEWIIVRRHDVTQHSHAVRQRLRELVAAGGYRRREIPYPDAAFENREDIRAHRFRTPRLPPVVIWEKQR
jgi:4-amino-4-deoxy-L-arabinose transferase-like glycosyltransferase